MNPKKVINQLIRKPAVRKIGIPAYRLYASSIRWRPAPKVLAISMPKAGTHLLGRTLDLFPKMMFSGLHLSEEDIFERNGLDTTAVLNNMDHLNDTLGRCLDGQYMTGHFPYNSSLYTKIKEHGFTILIIIRDPRDVAVSYVNYVCREPRHFHHKYYTQGLNTFTERLDATLHGFEKNSFATRGLVSLQRQMTDYQPWLQSPEPVFRFEDLIGKSGNGSQEDQNEAVRRIAELVARPLTNDQIKSIAGRAFSKNARTFHKGSAGGGATSYTAEQLDYCAETLDTLIASFGYPETHTYSAAK